MIGLTDRNSFTNAYGNATKNSGSYNTTINTPCFIKSKEKLYIKSLYN